MKIFIAGATGVIGRRVVMLLVEGGHAVAGLSRSPANAEWLARNGAEPREGDLFDREGIQALVAGCQAVLHLATAIPTKARTTPADWAENDRIRREGTRNLVEAALGSGCRLYLQQSVTFVYGDRDGAWVDERDRIAVQPGSLLESAVEMEGIVQSAASEGSLPAVILRFGTFYSHDSAQTRSMLELTRKGRFPVIGKGKAYWNLIHVDDAARAVVRAIELPEKAAGRLFNVCDDEPVTYRKLSNHLAETLGSRKPPRLPVALARILIGTEAVDFLRASVRCRNQSIKEVLGWNPNYPSYREGFRSVIEAWQRRD